MCVRNKYFVALAVYAIIITAIHLIRPGGESFMTLASAAVDLISISIAVILGVSAVRYFGLSTRQGRSMAFLTAGLFMWLLSEAFWVTVARGSATAAVTDFAFIMAYPFLIAGIFYGFRTLDLGFRREMLVMPALVSILLAGTAAMILLLNQNVAGASLLKTLFIYVFSIADAVLLIPIFLLVRKVFSGFFSRPWMLIGLALLLHIAGQAMINSVHDTYRVGMLIDLPVYFSYIAFGAAFVTFEHDTKRFVAGVRDKKHGKEKEIGRKREYKKAGRNK
jgi:hypothetical protein